MCLHAGPLENRTASLGEVMMLRRMPSLQPHSNPKYLDLHRPTTHTEILAHYSRARGSIQPSAMSLFGISISTTVVSTFVSIQSDNVVPLTTTFTPELACTSRWLQPWVDIPWIVSNYNNQLYGPFVTRDRLFETCRPGNVQNAKYSPGLCPSGQKIAKLTEYVTLPQSSDQSNRMWEASCCPKLVF